MTFIDLFDNMRFWGDKRNIFLSKIYFYPICNRIIDTLANIILPLYFRITGKNTKYSLTTKKTDKSPKEKIIVSLTSFHVRIPKLWIVVESILRQSVKPDRIILHLQVKDIKELPKRLLEMQKRGVEIEICDTSLRSHNKYWHVFKKYPNDCIITIDDDIIYRSDFIVNLLNFHKEHPNTIITNWSKEIKQETPVYKNWPEATPFKKAKALLPIGVAGVLYPSGCMYKDVLDKRLIKELCLTADDIWLTCMALLNGTQKIQTDYKQHHLPVQIRGNMTLLSINKERNQVCVDNLNNYYHKKMGIKPFVDILE